MILILVGNIHDTFIREGPFTNQVTTDQALESIEQFKQECKDLRGKEEQLKRGLSIFKIGCEPNKELTELEEDLELLEAIWKVANEWVKLWNGWKVTVFDEIETDSMEQTAQGCFKKLMKLAREAKDKD